MNQSQRKALMQKATCWLAAACCACLGAPTAQTQELSPQRDGNLAESNATAPNLEAPNLEDPKLEDPKLTAHQLELPKDLDAVASPTQAELKELSQWVRWLCLMNLPPNVEDTRKWGKQRRVWDGVDVKLDGLRLDTKQRWKMANDGTWSRYLIEFVDPAKELQVDVKSFEVEPDGRKFKTSVWVVAPLKLFGRMNQFARDVQLISVSAKADALVRMKVDCQVDIKLLPVSFPPDVEFRPTVTDASMELLEFRVHEISQIHGEAAQWIGDGIRDVLDRKLAEYKDKLVLKMNQSIAKQQSKLRISASKWLNSSMNFSSKP